MISTCLEADRDAVSALVTAGATVICFVTDAILSSADRTWLRSYKVFLIGFYAGVH